MLLTPGLAVQGIYAAIRIRRSTPLAETGLREASSAVTELVLEVNPQRRTDFRLGKRLAFLVDDEVLSAPEIMQPLTGDTAQLPGPFTALDQAEEVAAAIPRT